MYVIYDPGSYVYKIARSQQNKQIQRGSRPRLQADNAGTMCFVFMSLFFIGLHKAEILQSPKEQALKQEKATMIPQSTPYRKAAITHGICVAAQPGADPKKRKSIWGNIRKDKPEASRIQQNTLFHTRAAQQHRTQINRHTTYASFYNVLGILTISRPL